MGGTLGLVNAKDSTWSEGIAQAYAGSVFVAPPLGSWTLAVGLPLAPADDTEGSVRPALEELGRRFGEAQYFSTHRVSEFHVWARAVGGKLVRAYGYVGDSGETVWNLGAKTEEEKRLGFDFFDETSPESESDGYFDREDLRYPGEEDVMRIAGVWSVDPTRIGERFREPGIGLLGTRHSPSSG